MKRNRLFLISFLICAFTLSGCDLVDKFMAMTFNKNASTESGFSTETSIEDQHVHTYSEEWSISQTHHWHASTCGHDVKSNYESHLFGPWQIISNPTLTEKGEQCRTCSVCGYVDTRFVDELIMNTNSEVYEIYGDLEITKLPFKMSGIVVNEIVSISENEVKFILTNETGDNLTWGGRMSYKTYDENGYLKQSTFVFLQEMDKGESAYQSIKIDSTIRKIQISSLWGQRVDRPIYEGETQKIEHLTSNKLPYIENGISVDFHSLTDQKLTMLVTNKNAETTGKNSSIYCRVYDDKNIIVNNYGYSIHHLDVNESIYINVPLSEDISKVIFGNVSVTTENEWYKGEYDDLEGLSINKLPYVAGDITIESAERFNLRIQLLIRNTSTHAVSNESFFHYKYIDSDGVVKKTDYYYIAELDPGEACYATLWIDETVSILKIGYSETIEATTFYDGPLEEIDGVYINKLPYQTNGFTVLSAKKISSIEFRFVIRNDTGHPTDMSSKINIKKLNSNGLVVGSYNYDLYQLDPGESCYFKLSATLDVATIKIGQISSYETSAEFYSGKLVDVDGIQVNEMPFVSDNLTLESAERSENKLNLTITNNNEFTTDAMPQIYYKVIDKDGIVTLSRVSSLKQLVPHESTVFEITINLDTAIVKISKFRCSLIK